MLLLMKHISLQKKMFSCFFLLYFPFIIFIIFLAVSTSNGANINYTACSILYSCGNITNVGYPFWGNGRPDFCGKLDFKLSCRGDRQPYPTMHIIHPRYNPLRVLDINTSSHTMVVSQNFSRCYSNNLSFTSLPPTLKTVPYTDYKDLHLFYGCSDCHSAARYHFKPGNCSSDDDTKSTNGSVYYFAKQLDASRCSCKNNVSFLLDERGLDELGRTNASLQSILTKWPIRLEYKVNFTACSKCEDSGGRCGSLGDSASDQFVCHCKDGTMAQVCPKSERKKFIVLALGIGGGLFVLVAIVVICYCKKLSHSKFKARSLFLESRASELEKGSRYFGVPLFSYSELVAATDNFDESKELGSGGFGTVYHGKLKDGRDVAVKRLFEKNYRRKEQFMNEVQILTRFRHQHLVSLYGCTSHHSRELLLVYEYVKNGTVADHLYGEYTKSGFLSWPVRLRIAIETATALSHLHASDIIHRDVKTNNILLDSNFSVKVADFGLSRLFPTDKTHVSTAPQGTPGYLDPEYHLCYQLTDKSDVYSFGVVLIELISSLPAVDMDRHRLEINLSYYAMNKIQRCAFDELIDPQLGFASDFKVRRMTILVAELAFRCLQHNKEFRPSMDEVLEILKRIESSDYEALLAEEMVKTSGQEVVKMHSSNPPLPSPTEDDYSQLLRNQQQHPPSPISVIEKWISRSTISSSSK